MQKNLEPIKPIPLPARTATRASSTVPSRPRVDSPAVPVGPAQRREIPATRLKLEPRPLSAYDDNPVFDEIGAAFLLGLKPDTLKKWRQRQQGPDYIQYGPNGPVRYELKTLIEFRDKYTLRIMRKG